MSAKSDSRTCTSPRFSEAESRYSVPQERLHQRSNRRSMPPAALPRACADCDRPARRGGTRCERCHQRAWRDANQDRAEAAEKKRSFSPEATTLRKARATIAMALNRGHLRCGNGKTMHLEISIYA